MTRPLSLLLALSLLFTACRGTDSAQAERARRPNIVVILADDMGWGDLGIQNPDSRIPTPHLDGLAREGMRFVDAHSPSAVCTPTRYGLLTGRYAWRTRMKSGVLNGYGEPLITDERLTLPEFLAAQGYATAMVGKWHLGLGFQRDGEEIDYSLPVTDGPHTHGFGHSYIIPASLDFPPYVYIEDGSVTALPTEEQPAVKFPAFLRKGPRGPDLDMEGCLDHLADKAVELVKELAPRERPYFLYFALTSPHKPVLPHRRFQGHTEFGPYGDFIAQTDAAVGRVLAAVDGSEREDTLVIYTSDNGSFMYRTDGEDHVDVETRQSYRPENHTANGPLRGTKADIWEAGHRVPFLVRWPRRVRAGTLAEPTVCHTDLFATFADVIGVPLPPGAGPDGASMLPLFEQREADHRREAVVHHSANGTFAIRQGAWKLVLSNGSGGREKPSGKPFEKPYALFDLASDLGEQVDRIGERPEVAARLEKELERIRRRDQ